MNPAVGVIVSVVAILIAACGIAVTAVGLRRKTDADDTGRLERRVQELEGQNIQQGRELDECKRARAAFAEQNFALLLELHQMRQKTGDA